MTTNLGAARPLLLSLALAGTGCSGLDLTPVTAVLDASAALGLGGAAAMTAIAGEGPSCVSLTPACTAAPCAARVEVAVSEECPLALGPAASGTVVLDGEWSSLDTATFVPDLSSLDLGVESGRVSLGLGLVVVDRAGDEVEVVFSEQGVAAGTEDGGSTAGVEQAAYTVRVALGGTPGDPTDDVLDISGGNQDIDAGGGEDAEASVDQLAITTVVTAPDCRLNPVEGGITMNRVGDGDVSQTQLSFHGDCDGEVDVIASTADPTLSGSSTDLGYGE